MENNINLEAEFIQLDSSLKAYLYRLSANKEDAEDLFQDTFIRVQKNVKSFKGKSSFKTWVFSIATNLAKDNQRIKNRRQLDAQDKCRNEEESHPARWVDIPICKKLKRT